MEFREFALGYPALVHSKVLACEPMDLRELPQYAYTKGAKLSEFRMKQDSDGNLSSLALSWYGVSIGVGLTPGVYQGLDIKVTRKAGSSTVPTNGVMSLPFESTLMSIEVLCNGVGSQLRPLESSSPSVGGFTFQYIAGGVVYLKTVGLDLFDKASSQSGGKFELQKTAPDYTILLGFKSFVTAEGLMGGISFTAGRLPYKVEYGPLSPLIGVITVFATAHEKPPFIVDNEHGNAPMKAQVVSAHSYLTHVTFLDQNVAWAQPTFNSDKLKVTQTFRDATIGTFLLDVQTTGNLIVGGEAMVPMAYKHRTPITAGAAERKSLTLKYSTLGRYTSVEVPATTTATYTWETDGGGSHTEPPSEAVIVSMLFRTSFGFTPEVSDVNHNGGAARPPVSDVVMRAGTQADYGVPALYRSSSE
jgi:hypothetical protein